MSNQEFIISTFYKFTSITNTAEVKYLLFKVCKNNNILGTILIAQEGINATISGSRNAINNFYDEIKVVDNLNDLKCKETVCKTAPFTKLKIKIKNEIIKFGVAELNTKNTGKHLNSDEWEKLIDSGSLIIDTRNNYEINLGTFKNAINPNIRNFTDLVKWIDEKLNDYDLEQPIGMFCTGGVRCEKSTSYLLTKGFTEVYQLDGGIIQYLQEADSKKQYWKGNCFVFDNRIAIDHDLNSQEII